MPNDLMPVNHDQYARLQSRWERQHAPAHVGETPLPTRSGFDPTDSKTPFIEERLAYLNAYYHSYDASYTDYFVAYSDVILLRDDVHGFHRGRNIADLILRPRPDLFAPAPALRAHAESAVELFGQLGRLRQHPDGTYEDNTAVRFCNWPTEANEIEIQPAKYLSQIATNLTLDWCSGKLSGGQPGATIRNTFELPRDGRLPPLKPQSRLANTLGVAVMLRSTDNQLLLTIRSAKTAVLNTRDRVHCSASGVFEWKDLEWQDGVLPFSTFLNGMRREIDEELNLPEDSYTLVPLALARELPRGGKPQLFCAADCRLPLANIKQVMKSARDRYEWKDPADLAPDSPIRQALTQPESIPVDRANVENFFTYEGWMAWSLFEAYDKHQTIFGL